MSEESLQEKLERENGLCTSLMHNAQENSRRIKFILDAYLSGIHIQRSIRASGNWEDVCDLPMDFRSYYYRCFKQEKEGEQKMAAKFKFHVLHSGDRTFVLLDDVMKFLTELGSTEDTDVRDRLEQAVNNLKPLRKVPE